MVEWKKLGEICSIVRGKRVTKSELVENGIYPVISGGVSCLGYLDKFNRESNTITIAQYGTAGYIDIQKEKFWANDVCYSLFPANSILNMFLYYSLKNRQRDIYALRTNAVPAHLPQKELAEVIIPLPPLLEQNRIVGILDTFTSSIENLKEQIAQRRKQYEYYRDQLLDLEGKEGVEMKTLNTLCDIKGRIGFRGYTREDQVCKGEGALSLTATNITDQRIDYSNNTYITWDKYYESPEIMVENGDIIVCQRGSIGKIAFVEDLPEKATINPQLLLVKNIKINKRYLKYILLSSSFQYKLSQIIGHGTVQMISQKDFKNLMVPVLSHTEQQRIVDILDKFEESIQNLEAQLAQREKQYEYYRNKLLTFE